MNPTTFGAEFLEAISAGTFGCGCGDRSGLYTPKALDWIQDPLLDLNDNGIADGSE